MLRDRIDHPPDEIVLRALHQRRHHDREADPGGHADHRHQVCRARLFTWVSAISSIRFMARPAASRSMRTRAPVGEIGAERRGRRDRRPASPASTSTARVPRMPTSIWRLPIRVADHHRHGRALHGIGRNQQRVGMLARHDIGFHAHAGHAAAYRPASATRMR